MTKIPVYLYPQEYAMENGELDKYRTGMWDASIWSRTVSVNTNAMTHGG